MSNGYIEELLKSLGVDKENNIGEGMYPNPMPTTPTPIPPPSPDIQLPSIELPTTQPNLERIIAANKGRLRGAGLNLDAYKPTAQTEIPDIFKQISAQYQDQRLAGNIDEEPVGPPTLDKATPVDRKLTSVPKDEGIVSVSPIEQKDTELEDALRYQRESAETAALGKAGARLGAAIAGLGAKAVLTPATEGFEDIAKLGEGRVKEVLTKRKGMEEFFNLQDAKAMADASSPVSKALRQGAAAVGLTLPENVTGSQLKASGLNLGNLLTAKLHSEAQKEASASRREQAEENRALRREQFEQRKKQNIQKASESFFRQMQADPVMKQLKKEKVALDQVNKLIDAAQDGNTVAASAMGTKLARAMGEVGVLTETDVVRYMQSRMITQKVADKLSDWIKGRPSKATLDEIRQISQALKSTFDEKIQPLYDEYAVPLSRQYDIPLDEAYYLMGTGRPTPITQDPKIQEWADKYGKSYEEAEKILKARGYKGGGQ